MPRCVLYIHNTYRHTHIHTLLQALQRLVKDAATLRALPNTGAHGRASALPQHWACDFFLASACLELQENMEALSKLQRLSHVSECWICGKSAYACCLHTILKNMLCSPHLS